jgi:uncharacterized membrane protein
MDEMRGVKVVERGEETGSGSRRHGLGTSEFSRVANLSDAVFAIAMTLLVLTLDVPRVPPDRLAEALVDRIPQLIAFVVSFALVANIWWAHHKHMALLGSLEPGLIVINLAFLGGVALVPFPTALIGGSPTAHAAVLPFIALFIVLLFLFLLLILRSHAVAAWRRPLPDELFPWVRGLWILSLAGMVLAFLIALWVPVAGLIAAALNGAVVGVVMDLVAPPAYRKWR